MSWAEFVLRSIGFKEEREFKMLMTREIAYQAHSMQYVFGKKSPPKKEKFWNIGDEKKPISKEIPKAFLKAREEYLKAKK